MCFGNYGLPKTQSDQSLKSRFSEDPPKSNMVNAPKYCSNLKESSFTIFIDHWAVNCSTKTLY